VVFRLLLTIDIECKVSRRQVSMTLRHVTVGDCGVYVVTVEWSRWPCNAKADDRVPVKAMQ
jgi:hypothetical protein